MRFVKYHGTGNDFILLKEEDTYGEDYSALARKMCHRNYGIGADGLIVASYSKTQDMRMQYYNQDGSEAPMCGNGLRCFARFVHEEGLEKKRSFTVETLGGEMSVQMGSSYENITVSMELPLERLFYPYASEKIRLGEARTLTVHGNTFELFALFLGTLHGVIFTDREVSEEEAKELCHHELFPERINVNFVKRTGEAGLHVRTYERGVGFTLSCGTGAMASAYMANLVEGFPKNISVRVPGGDLWVSLDEKVHLTGPSVKIAEGVMYVE